MMKPISRIVLPLALLALLPGCWDMQDLQSINYITSIGIDYTENQYHIYGQMVDFAHVAKQESGKQTEPAVSWIGLGKEPTVSFAASRIYDTSQQPLLWSHITAIVLTKQALKKGIEPIIDGLNRYREIRFTPWIFGTEEDIVELFDTPAFFNLSAIETTLHEPESHYKQESWIKPTRSLTFTGDLEEPGRTVILPSIGINSKEWLKNKKPEPKLMLTGAYLIYRHKLRGWLGKKDLSGLRWMDESTERTILDLKSDGEPIGTIVLWEPRVTIRQSFKEGLPRYSIKVKLKASIDDLIQRRSESELASLAEADVKEQIMDTFRKALEIKSDIYQLEYETYRHHYRIWKEWTDGDPFPLTENSIERVDVQVRIVHSGMLK